MGQYSNQYDMFKVKFVKESWLDNTVTNAEIHIEGYNIVRLDNSRNGGGVCVFIREDIAFSPRQDLHDDRLEALWIDILIPNTKTITIGTVYRPPKEASFLINFEEILNKLNQLNELYIVGDINKCLLHKKSSLCKNYMNILQMSNLKQLLCEPTRITENSKTLLDHVIVNSEDRVSQSGVIPIGLSDHFITYFTRKFERKTISDSGENLIKIRSTKNYNKEDFCKKLNDANWSELYLCREVNGTWAKRYFYFFLNEAAPKRDIKIKKHTEPWMTSEIIELNQKRDLLLNIWAGIR
ncbi:unnamed protein product [Mytilus edulis]|uniref:Endonuclease/exonuclease/phosphatase domain-containing protein n=1 Tax=Mytilus edulis TaxID=6550 RepID=A0A8S3RAW6_MYTED|nr:unnamed protein product [Mytilus edulis]